MSLIFSKTLLLVFATSNQNKVRKLILVVMSPVLLGSDLSDSRDAEGIDHPEKPLSGVCAKGRSLPMIHPASRAQPKLKGAGRPSVGWPRDREMSL